VTERGPRRAASSVGSRLWWVWPAALLASLVGLLGRALRRTGQKPEAGLSSPAEAQLSEPPGEAGSAGAEIELPFNVQLRVLPGTRIRLTIEALPEEGQTGAATVLYRAERRVPATPGERRGWKRITAGASRLMLRAREMLAPGGRPAAAALTLDRGLFLLALVVYAATRLIRLEDWPIYFFTDEANQTLLALAFVRDGFRDQFHTLFPTYFRNVYQFNLSTSVYAQVIPYLLFGRSIFVTRATAALLTLPGAAAIGLALRDAFGKRFWWVGVFALSLTPAWFLHSRTAFETTMMVSFFACALYFYLRYRSGRPRALYGAVHPAGAGGPVLLDVSVGWLAAGLALVAAASAVLLYLTWRLFFRLSRDFAAAL